MSALHDFITRALAAGQTEEVIRAALLAEGWDEAVVSAAFAAVRAEQLVVMSPAPAVTQPARRLWLWWILGFLLLVVVGVGALLVINPNLSAPAVENTEDVIEKAVAVQAIPDSWIAYTNPDLNISFSYPKEYGTVVIDRTLGAPADFAGQPEQCQIGGTLVDTLACTGAIVSFEDENSQKTPFFSVHGRYTYIIAPQGGWWGFQDQARAESLVPWTENPTLLGEPNTKMYRIEMGGDTKTQIVEVNSAELSHIVFSSPIEFGAVSEESRAAFRTHLETVPPPPAYEATPEWTQSYERYVTDVEMFDVKHDPKVQEYLQVLKTIRLDS